MTENLPALFEGKEIRAIERDGEIWIPISDIAKAWGVDRSTPDNIINRNTEAFAGFADVVLDATSTPMSCLNERGLYLMMGKISTNRLKNEEAKKTIIRFQRWFPELIQKYRKQGIIEVHEQPSTRLLSDDVREALKVARIISEETGVSLPIAQSFALEKVGAGDWQKLLPAATMASGYLTPSDIGDRIGKSAHQVNLWLYNNKLQVKDEITRDWRLTDAGKMHAEEFPFTRNGHSGYQIKWRDSILPLMNISLISGPQQALSFSG